MIDMCVQTAVGQSAIWIVPCPSKLFGWCCGAPHDGSCCDSNSTIFFSLDWVQPLSLNKNIVAAPNSTCSGTPSTSSSSTGAKSTSPEGSVSRLASCGHDIAVGTGIGVASTSGAVLLIAIGCVLLRNQRSRRNAPRQSQEIVTHEDAQRVNERTRHELLLPPPMLDGTPFRPELEASGRPSAWVMRGILLWKLYHVNLYMTS